MPAAGAHVRAPKQGRSRQSFERIIEATIELLRERDYDQLTLAEICRRAGVSTGALYGRVDGKDGLLRVVQTVFLDRLAAQFDHEAARIAGLAGTLETMVPAVVSGLGQLLHANAAVLRAFMLRGPADPAIHQAGWESGQVNNDKFTALLRRCEGEIRHPQPRRAIASSMQLIYASQARFLGLDSVGGTGDEDVWQQLLLDLSDMVLAFLQSGGNPARGTREDG